MYSGQTKLTDTVENSPIDAGKLVLSPTRTYAPVIKKDTIKIQFKSNSWNGSLQWWCTNKVFHFVDNVHVIKDNLFAVPPLFKLIQENSKRIGKKCTKFSTVDTVWKFTFLQK